MEKARKTKVSTQNVNTSCLRQKSVKKHNNKDIILCEKISVLDDENANDANSIIQSGPSKRKDEIKEKDVSPLKTAQCLNSSIKQSTDESEFDCKIEDRVLVSDAVNPNSVSLVYNNVSSIITERSSRKRKEFKLSNSYKEVAAEAAAKRYDSSRVCDSSSDENSSSSRGTSLDVIIPPPKNFLGLNNPFRIITPKKNIPASQMIGTSSGCVQNLLNFNRSGTMIKSSIFNTTALDFSSKLAALKSAGIFPNLSTSNLAKAAGQPRTVRTIKRRLSAKDITIGPNQEVRRRRTRRLSSNVEVELSYIYIKNIFFFINIFRLLVQLQSIQFLGTFSPYMPKTCLLHKPISQQQIRPEYCPHLISNKVNVKQHQLQLHHFQQYHHHRRRLRRHQVR